MFFQKVLSYFFRFLPLAAALSIGKGLGILVYHLARRRRAMALDNLEKALGNEKTAEEIRWIARSSFKHLGMNLAEFFRYFSLDERSLREIVHFEGEENLKAALEKGRGVLALSAHLGNWELISLSLARRGYPLAVISKIPRSREVGRFWIGSRERMGIKILRGRGLLREGIRHLAGGGILGFVLDQNARCREGVFVPFFGREACTLKSLALLARRTGAPVLPAFTFREGMEHRVVFEKPFNQETTDDLEGDVLRWTGDYTAWTERVVRLHPEQWTWLHQRWRTRPKKGPTSNVQGPLEEKWKGEGKGRRKGF